jgi:integrase
MTISKHAKSPYWYYSFMVDGKAYYKSTKTTNKALAQKIENEARRKIIEGQHFNEKETCTLSEIIDEYLATREGGKSYNKDQVYARKLLGHKMCPRTRTLSDVYGFDGTKPFHELKQRDLFRLHTARKSEGISPSTFLHELLFINGLITTAKQLGYQTPELDIREFKTVQKIRPSKGKVRYLTPDEEAKLLLELNPQTPVRGQAAPENLTPPARRARQDVYDLTVFLLDTGARHTEVAAMEWKNVDLDKGVIHLYRSKVNNESVIPMTNRVKEMLFRRLSDTGEGTHIFANKSGDGVRNYSPAAFKAACRRAGIEGVTFHTLRHTAASRLAQAGVSLQDIACLLGHSTIVMSQKYAHLSPSESLNRSIAVLNS